MGNSIYKADSWLEGRAVLWSDTVCLLNYSLQCDDESQSFRAYNFF